MNEMTWNLVIAITWVVATMLLCMQYQIKDGHQQVIRRKTQKDSSMIQYSEKINDEGKEGC